ncbi:MAG: hypothetical protein KUG66_01255 [Gammaproteobacteria bacterium]|nr:hypothetical protein [Gammaproteobacteria bacterium]
MRYNLGLRLGESRNFKVFDPSSHLMRGNIRHAKNNKDRFVPLPLETLKALRRYWKTHRHSEFLKMCTSIPFVIASPHIC